MSGRVIIPVTAIARTGVAQGSAVVASSTNKHYLENDGRTFLLVVSTDAGDQTIAAAIATLVDGQAVSPRSISVPAGATILAGPFPVGTYSQEAIAASG